MATFEQHRHVFRLDWTYVLGTNGSNGTKKIRMKILGHFAKVQKMKNLDLSSTNGEETANLGQLLANELDSTAAPVGFRDFSARFRSTLPVPPPLDLSHLGAAANLSIDDDNWLPDYKVPDVNATRKYTPPPRNNRNRVFFPIGPAALDREMPANARTAILQDARETELSRLRRQAFLLTGKEAIMRNFIAHNELYAERRIANFEQLYIQVEAHLENRNNTTFHPGSRISRPCLKFRR